MLLELDRLEGPDQSAGSPADDLAVLVYDELRSLARRLMSAERRNHTLQATAVVHEAYLKLVDQTRVGWQGRAHFLAVAAQAMRRVLCDHARRHRSRKRGGDWKRVTLHDDAFAPSELAAEELLALDTALTRLAGLDERQAQVVELRTFAGLTVDEVATLLGVSRRTVEKDWTHARVWLRRELAAGEDE